MPLGLSEMFMGVTMIGQMLAGPAINAAGAAKTSASLCNNLQNYVNQSTHMSEKYGKIETMQLKINTEYSNDLYNDMAKLTKLGIQAKKAHSDFKTKKLAIEMSGILLIISIVIALLFKGFGLKKLIFNSI